MTAGASAGEVGSVLLGYRRASARRSAGRNTLVDF